MTKDEVKSFSKFEVYEYLGDKKHTICLCNEYIMAEGICRLFAKTDPKGDTYYYTGITEPGTFIPGGGWYVGFKKNDKGEVEKFRLS